MEFIKILPNIGFVIFAGILITAVNRWNIVEGHDYYSSSGYLIVPVSDYPTFEVARIYAKEVLQDSTSTWKKQWFLWRGGFFSTETD
jgi:hypothetical protein